MGLYVNPENESKEEFLNREGELVSEGNGYSHIDFDLVPNNMFIVCLVNNGYFTAGGVAYSEREFKMFDEPDGRPKKWYIVDKDKLAENCPEWNQYEEYMQ